MNRFLLILLLGLSACGLVVAPQPTPTPTATATSAPALLPEAALGTEKNPLILALAPSPHPAQEAINAGNALAAQLEDLTGYVFVTVSPASEADLVTAFDIGNAHIGVLSPFAYLLARQGDSVRAEMASLRGGEPFYGAQFIARKDAGFKSYYDTLREENTAKASEALAQFNDKKPCWTDPASPSGYVVPLGFLMESGVQTREPAFVQGHATVVRAVYATGICDFGATYIDAREFPGLEDEFPDVMKKVIVVWRIPPIIPYETLVFASSLPQDMQRALLRALVDMMATPQGKSAVQTIYGIDALQIVQDSQYEQFRSYVEASDLNLKDLLK